MAADSCRLNPADLLNADKIALCLTDAMVTIAPQVVYHTRAVRAELSGNKELAVGIKSELLSCRSRPRDKNRRGRMKSENAAFGFLLSLAFG